jgi:cytosine/adenosine deaminase-related metal-dependent hydrolase
MILKGARVAQGPGKAAPMDIDIQGTRIRALREPGEFRGPGIDLSGCLVLPGLINAHDHLHFNLFPRLGRGPYASAAEWAREIYRPEESPVREHCRVPRSVRLAWGGIKNLLSGVTTVCHHDRLSADCKRDFPVRVLQKFGWAHSLEFSPDLAERFRRTPQAWPFFVHVGEAVDALGRRAIYCLDRMGALDSRTVLVHAVALDQRGWALVLRKRASAVWCPSSNLFLLGRTLERPMLESGIPMALGTDSALTAEGDLLDELHVARRAAGLPPETLYRMVTECAARILRLPDGAGAVIEGGTADLIAFTDEGRTPAAALLDSSGPKLVVLGGEIKLACPALARQLPLSVRRRLHPVAVEGRPEVLVRAPVARLYRQAARVLGPVIHLAGRRVAAC